MAVRLSTGELIALGELEARLRETDPALDRRLGRRRTRLDLLLWRPWPLVVAVASLATATAAGLICAAAFAPAAALPAALSAVGLVLAFRRLARIAGR